MGIRFFCPIGHKLHVKSHLAGLKGFCPECGAELVVPLQSTRKSSKEGGGPINQSDTNNPQQPDIFSYFENTQNQTELDPNTNPVLQDALTDWYIYDHENGNQEGPIKTQALQNMIRQKKINPETLLWREGWESWVQADNVFPELYAT
ncbi:MAG: DUF4339 domain-containing protein [Planctomycetaceae bacterium]|jgi:hypothetical protein|nr:DUF4339 domain-containing protein [Planctomycetaceae bacterium]